MDAAIAGKTLCDILARNASTYGDRPALSFRRDGGWVTATWREYRDRVMRLAAGFRNLGVRRGDCVVIMSRNRPEHLVCDLAALHLGATGVSLYNTFSPEQIAHAAAHCAARVAVVEGPDLLGHWNALRHQLPALEHIVGMDEGENAAGLTLNALEERGRATSSRERNAVEQTWKAVIPSDPATIVYTSGTTAAPKGVVLTNHNALWTAASVDAWGKWPMGFKYVSYLPLAHSLERLAAHWVCMYKAASVYFCPEVLGVFDVLGDVHPYAFVSVPRLWEKLEGGIVATLHGQTGLKRAVAERAIDVGRRATRREQSGERVPVALKVQRALLDRVVLKKIRQRIGLDEAVLVLSGAAPLSPEVAEFFFSLGVRIAEGYGMSESTAPATINPPDRPRIGTVGPPIPGVEVSLLDDGELLIRGGNVAPGYHKDDDLTARTFDEGGWLHSGDIAEIDSDGHVRIVDRKKELIVTAGGKNVSPSNLENMLKRHPLVSNACVVGDNRPYIAALVVLDGEEAAAWARREGIGFESPAELASNERVNAEIGRGVDEINARVSRPEGIKRFEIVADEWEPGGPELTPTLKLKRRAIHDKYGAEIARLYP